MSDRRRLTAAALCATGLLSARSGESPESEAYFAPDNEMKTGRVPTYEEFKAKARVSGVSHELYLVEWDFPILSEAELRAYYDARHHGHQSKSAVKLTPQVGPDTLQCNTNPPPSSCIDDKFYQHEQLGLRYCVSNDFGANKAAIVANMEQAAHAWQQVANAWFRYVPTHDASCRQTDPVPSSVDFKVAPWTGNGACAYWPYSGRSCVPKTLVYNTGTDFSPNTMPGVLAHELGHILGFHHEHNRADVASEFCEVYEMRYLTPNWDPSSIMGYPAAWGGCSIGGGNTVTEADGVGARALYGPPTAWIIATGS